MKNELRDIDTMIRVCSLDPGNGKVRSEGILAELAKIKQRILDGYELVITSADTPLQRAMFLYNQFIETILLEKRALEVIEPFLDPITAALREIGEHAYRDFWKVISQMAKQEIPEETILEPKEKIRDYVWRAGIGADQNLDYSFAEMIGRYYKDKKEVLSADDRATLEMELGIQAEKDHMSSFSSEDTTGNLNQMPIRKQKNPVKLKDIITGILLGIGSIASIFFIWWLVTHAKESTPQEECRLMMSDSYYPPNSFPPPSRVFELGCDTMQEFKKYRKH